MHSMKGKYQLIMKKTCKTLLLALLALILCAFMASCGTGSSGTGSTESIGATESTGNPTDKNEPETADGFTSAVITETKNDAADAEITEFSVGFLTETAYNNGNYDESAITKTTYSSSLSASYMVIDFKIKTLNNIENKSVKVMARVSDGLGMTVVVEDAPTGKVEPVDNPDGSKSYDLIYALPESKDAEKSVRMILKVLPYAGGEVSVDVSVSGIDGAAVKGKTGASTAFMAPSPNLKFELKEDGTYSVRGTGACTYSRLFIPSSYEGVSVTSIESHEFSDCSKLTSIEIPDSVTSIGDDAFSGCSSLTNIEIPGSVTSIGYDTFRGCSSLTSIEIPDSVTSIGDDAFSGCTSLTSISIPDSVTSIGNLLFNDCTYLTSITLPKSVISMGNFSFRGCSKLTSIVIPDGVTSIGDEAFYGCNSLTSINIPDSVTSIGDSAFYGCSKLTSILIPEGVTSIGDDAFYGCNSLTGFSDPACGD